MEFSINDALMIIICGLFGGFINCILFQAGLTLPYSEKGPKNERVYKLGSLGPIILGVAASLLAWGFGVGQMTNLRNELALLVLSGIGGGSFITNLLQRQQMKVEREISTAAINVAKYTVNQLSEVKQAASEKRRKPSSNLKIDRN